MSLDTRNRHIGLTSLITVVALTIAACSSTAGETASTTITFREVEQPPGTTTTEIPTPDTSTTSTTLAEDGNAAEADVRVTDQERGLADAFSSAYNENDFDALAALFPSTDPTLESVGDGGIWDSDEIRSDLAFAEVVEDVWTVESCKKDFGRVTCHFSVKDTLTEQRALDTQRVTLFFDAESDAIENGAVDLHRGLTAYDREMHGYGDWYDQMYPKQIAIQGFHYRGWNTEDPAAAVLFMEHLDEWIASLDQ